MESVFYGENAIDYTIVVTNANQEYSLLLPEAVKAIEIQARGAVDIRFSFAAGKVATPTDPYRTLKSGSVYSKNNVYINATTLYVACGSATQNVEVRVWI